MPLASQRPARDRPASRGRPRRVWTLDPLGNWDQWKFDADFSGSFSAAESEDRTHNGVNELLDRNQGTGGPLEDGETLTYDLAGNLRTRVANSVTTTYTHDAWNRLVKVVAGSATLLEQQDAASIGGLSWRTWKRSDTNANGTLDEERTFAYDPSWRLVEERVDADYPTRPGLDRRVQHVWGKRYIDDPNVRGVPLHRRDGNNDGDYLDANEGTWYHLTDAMYSTVALFSGASVVERVTYTPYGEARHHFGNDVTGDGGTDASDQAIVLGAWGTTIGNAGYLAEADLDRDGSIGSADLSIVLSYATALAPGLISSASPTGPDSTIGWDGYVFNPETRLYTVRHRSYLPVLGRWMERDPAGYVDGMSLYCFVRSSPVTNSDASGLRCELAAEARIEIQQSCGSTDPVKQCRDDPLFARVYERFRQDCRDKTLKVECFPRYGKEKRNRNPGFNCGSHTIRLPLAGGDVACGEFAHELLHASDQCAVDWDCKLKGAAQCQFAMCQEARAVARVKCCDQQYLDNFHDGSWEECVRWFRDAYTKQYGDTYCKGVAAATMRQYWERCRQGLSQATACGGSIPRIGLQ